MIRIQTVRPDSIASDLGIQPGALLFRIDDHDVSFEMHAVLREIGLRGIGKL